MNRILIAFALFSLVLMGSAATIAWQKTDSAFFTQPILLKGNLYALSNDGIAFALDPMTGKEYWRYDSGGTIDAAPATSNLHLIFGNRNGKIYAISLDSGGKIWTISTNATRVTGLVATNNFVYVNTLGKLYALEVATGKERWNVTTSNIITTAPVLSASNVFFGSGSDLVAVDLSTGIERFRKPVGVVWQSNPLYADNVVYIGTTDGKMHAFSSSSGSPIWEYETSGWVVGTPIENNGVIYFGATDYTAYAVDAKTGELLWKRTLSDAITTNPALITPPGGTPILAFATNDGRVWGLSNADGAVLWNINTGLLLYPGTSNDKFLFMGSKTGLVAITKTGCSIDDPADGSIIPDSEIIVRGTARAESGGVRSVSVSVDGGPFEDATGGDSWRYAFDAKSLGEEVTIECKAADNFAGEEDAPYTKIIVKKSKDAALRTMHVTYDGSSAIGGKIGINASDAQYKEPFSSFDVIYRGKTVKGIDGRAEITAEGEGTQRFVVQNPGYSEYEGYIDVIGGPNLTLIFGVFIVIVIIIAGYFLFKKPVQKK